MSIPRGQVSLKQVRQDLDLSAAGSIRDRAVLNRVNKRSGPISLSDHKGVAMGAQLTIVGNWNDPPNLRYNGYKTFYPSVSGEPSISGNTIITVAGNTGAGNGDSSCGYVCPFFVSESGSYTLLCDIEFNADLYYSLTQWQVSVITSPDGYLAGSTNLDLNKGTNRDIKGPLSYSVNLTTSRPYGVVVLYAIAKGGGNSSMPPSYARYTNTRLVKA